MKLDKAIEIITFYLNDKESPFNQDGKDALKISIEAIIFLELARHYNWAGSDKLLPGETNLPSPKL